MLFLLIEKQTPAQEIIKHLPRRSSKPACVSTRMKEAGLARTSGIGDVPGAYRRSRTPALMANIATYTCLHTEVPKSSTELNLAKHRRRVITHGRQINGGKLKAQSFLDRRAWKRD